MNVTTGLYWVAGVTSVIWIGIFIFCLTLDRRIRRLEEGS
jgi:CcmD family protein